MIVDSAVYVGGRRTAEALSPEETCEAVRPQEGGLAWIGLHAPTEEEFSSVAREFGLHPLAVEDAVYAHQRPKLERYDGGRSSSCSGPPVTWTRPRPWSSGRSTSS